MKISIKETKKLVDENYKIMFRPKNLGLDFYRISFDELMEKLDKLYYLDLFEKDDTDRCLYFLGATKINLSII